MIACSYRSAVAQHALAITLATQFSSVTSTRGSRRSSSHAQLRQESDGYESSSPHSSSPLDPIQYPSTSYRSITDHATVSPTPVKLYGSRTVLPSASDQASQRTIGRQASAVLGTLGDKAETSYLQKVEVGRPSSSSPKAFIPLDGLRPQPFYKPCPVHPIFRSLTPSKASLVALMDMPDAPFDPSFPAKIEVYLSTSSKTPSNLVAQQRRLKELKRLLAHVSPRFCMNEVSEASYIALGKLWSRWLDTIDSMIGQGSLPFTRTRSPVIIDADDFTPLLQVILRLPRKRRDSRLSSPSADWSSSAVDTPNEKSGTSTDLARMVGTMMDLGIELNADQMKIMLHQYTAAQILKMLAGGLDLEEHGGKPGPEYLHLLRTKLNSDEGIRLVKEVWRVRKALVHTALKLSREILGEDDSEVGNTRTIHSKDWDLGDLERTVSDIVLSTIEDAVRLALPTVKGNLPESTVGSSHPALAGELEFWLRRRDELYATWWYPIQDVLAKRFRPSQRTNSCDLSVRGSFTPSYKESVAIWLVLRDRLLPQDWRHQSLSSFPDIASTSQLDTPTPIELLRLLLGCKDATKPGSRLPLHPQFEKRIMASIIRIWNHYSDLPRTRSILKYEELLNVIAPPAATGNIHTTGSRMISPNPAPPLDIRLFKRILNAPRDQYEFTRILPILARLPAPRSARSNISQRRLSTMFEWCEWADMAEGGPGTEISDSTSRREILRDLLERWGFALQDMVPQGPGAARGDQGYT